MLVDVVEWGETLDERLSEVETSRFGEIQMTSCKKCPERFGTIVFDSRLGVSETRRYQRLSPRPTKWSLGRCSTMNPIVYAEF
jgi:hypothetical protein